MKQSSQMAQEGILTALSVVLLWLGAAVPAIGWGGCICAGLFPAAMLAKRQVRAAFVIYLATAVLSLLLVPGKRYVIGYLLLFGSYPMLKYAIERLRNLVLEWVCKLIYAGAICAVLYGLFQVGMLLLAPQLTQLPIFALTMMFFAGFICYDIIFSKMIALFHTFFP